MAALQTRQNPLIEEHPGVLILVDDDPAVLSALKFSLEVEGYSVRAYADGDSLLAERNFPYIGCLILDYRLPKMNGLQLLAELRKRRVTLPAVLITTPEPSVIAQAAAAKVPIVGKPLLGSALLDTVRDLLKPTSR
jgi:FixJ family two-component response regulator